MEMLLKTASERNKEQKSARGRGGDCFLFIIRSVSSNEGRRTMSPVHSGALIPAYAAHARLLLAGKAGSEKWVRQTGRKTGPGTKDTTRQLENMMAKFRCLLGEKVSNCGASLMLK